MGDRRAGERNLTTRETSMGKLEAIWLKRARRGPMDPVDEAVAVEDRGLEGGADFDGERHVTLVEREVFDRLEAEFDASVRPVMRRANLLVSGIRLEGTRGRTLDVGDLRIHIHGETRPCGRMDEACEGLRNALADHWGGGVRGSVVNDATIAVGDAVLWEESQ
jgi:MOSC domain-containing protein YiiM